MSLLHSVIQVIHLKIFKNNCGLTTNLGFNNKNVKTLTL